MLRTFIFTMIWNPRREMFPFNIPFLNRPILWYGFFFALGFFFGYWILRYLYSRKDDLQITAKEAAEKTILYVLVGGVVGARIGDLLFYQHISSLVHNPLAIFKIWEGGLASHGGAVGILIALALLALVPPQKKLHLSFRALLDFVVIPTALAGALIRIGNFFNQEILGTPTNLPWGILFLHPADGSAAIVRHPVQLYEAIFYFCLFVFLILLWRLRPSVRKEGMISGLFLVLLFGFRFFIEFIKVKQSAYIDTHALLTMGQYLSLPFIFLGIAFLFSRQLKEIKEQPHIHSKVNAKVQRREE